MTGISYFIYHLLAILLPGWLLISLSGFRANRLVYIPAAGYVYYVLLASLSKWLNLPLQSFYICYAIPLLALFLVGLKFHLLKWPEKLDRNCLSGLLIITIAYLIYRAMVGPYAEIPGDVYRHMEYARVQFDAITGGYLGREETLASLVQQKGGIWYSFFALLSFLSGQEFSVSLPWAMLANGLIFISVIYGFAWAIFESFDLSGRMRLLAALLATFFVASHLGINVFSYLRYYSMAPTMLNMVLYFAAVLAVLELLKWQAMQFRYSVFIVLVMAASTVVHNQETLFMLLSGGLMLGWFALCPESLKQGVGHGLEVRHRRYYLIMLLLMLIGFLVMQVWVYNHQPRPEPLFGKVIQLSEQGPILNRILYLDPTYQAIEVVTLWGLAVYVLFLVYWRRFIRHPFLFSGMLVPFVTVFNPLFVDWFLRIEGVHTLWRMLYIMPLHFVAALALVFLLQSFNSTQRVLKKIGAVSAMAALFLLLLPLGGINPNSRMTLSPTEADESYVYWQDLIDFLNSDALTKTKILTDPVTGYVLNGMTKHRTYQYKFFAHLMKDFNLNDYSDAPLKKYAGWLLVINDRNGGYSDTGSRSGHWDARVLKTGDFYTRALRTQIQSNPEGRFELIWSEQGIQVYRLH